jgi:hypothetical protein
LNTSTDTVDSNPGTYTVLGRFMDPWFAWLRVAVTVESPRRPALKSPRSPNKKNVDPPTLQLSPRVMDTAAKRARQKEMFGGSDDRPRPPHAGIPLPRSPVYEPHESLFTQHPPSHKHVQGDPLPPQYDANKPLSSVPPHGAQRRDSLLPQFPEVHVDALPL